MTLLQEREAIDESLALDRICHLIHQWCGVTLNASKHYLIQNRLRPVLAHYQLKKLSELIARACDPTGNEVRDRMIDALTTHETLFFRDSSPFDALAQIIVPEAERNATMGRPRLRIWSAACSTGQEPYSIAMRLLERIPDIGRWEIRILASDVSTLSIEQAKLGVYMDHEIRRGLKPDHERNFFDKVGGEWRIQARVRQLVQFQPGNLLSANQPTGPFDLIFCRNVAIYFGDEDRLRVFRMLASRLAPGGRLFVGCSEVLTNLTDVFQTERIGAATCYRKL